MQRYAELLRTLKEALDELFGVEQLQIVDLLVEADASVTPFTSSITWT